MEPPSRRNVLDLVEVALGGGLVLLALYLTARTYGPVDVSGAVPGRGLFAPFVLAPMAGLGGGVLAHLVPPRLSPGRRRVGRYAAVIGFSALAVVPCVGYVLLFGDAAFSKSPGSYTLWFVLAGVVGVVVAGFTDLRSW